MVHLVTQLPPPRQTAETEVCLLVYSNIVVVTVVTKTACLNANLYNYKCTETICNILQTAESHVSCS